MHKQQKAAQRGYTRRRLTRPYTASTSEMRANTSRMGRPLRYGFSSYLRLLRNGLSGFWLQKLARNFDALAHANTQHTVCNSWRQLVRPLFDSLIRDAHRLGSGGHITTQQFNGFGLQHDRINP